MCLYMCLQIDANVELIHCMLDKEVINKKKYNTSLWDIYHCFDRREILPVFESFRSCPDFTQNVKMFKSKVPIPLIRSRTLMTDFGDDVCW